MNSSPQTIGCSPVWRYGKTSAFGLWLTPLTDGALAVLLYKGYLFRRTTAFIQKVTETPATESTPASSKTTFKQRIGTTLVEVAPSGAKIPFADFPIVVFVSGTDVIYSGPEMKNFKKFGKVDAGSFYSTETANPAVAFDLPSLDGSVYSTKSETVEQTKLGLLTPLWRISVEKDSEGVTTLDEVLDLHPSDTFVFEDAEDEEEPEEPSDVCSPDGETGAPVTGPDDGVGGSGSGEVGVGGEGSGTGDSAKPCPSEASVEESGD